MTTRTPNRADHRFKAGDKVEYGTSGPHGGDRLGVIVSEWRQHGQDGYLIQPLALSAGDGWLPSGYPGRMVQAWHPIRWRYDQGGTWVRTYLELRFKTETAALHVSQREGVAVGRGLFGSVVRVGDDFLIVPFEPVNWAGRTFGELTAGERRRAGQIASWMLSHELTANAEAISAVLDGE